MRQPRECQVGVDIYLHLNYYVVGFSLALRLLRLRGAFLFAWGLGFNLELEFNYYLHGVASLLPPS